MFAKVSAPTSRAAFPRRRLFRALDAAGPHSIAWIVSPPGAGKTTLAASYIRARRRAHLWYEVDSDDGDPANLFHYLKHAAGRRASKLAAWNGNPSTLASFSRRWFARLFGVLPARALLVFDDYHAAPAGTLWHVALHEGLAVRPRECTVIVTSRAPPPLELVRLITTGELVVIDWTAMRLSADEAAGIGRQLAPASLHRDLPRLCEIADGWAAGLVLLLAQARGSVDTALRLTATEEIFAYFAAEIFDRLDSETQRILLVTAFGSRFDDQLVAELAGAAASRVLARLARRGLFLDTTVGSPLEYRYHPLFRGFLRARAVEMGPDELQRVRRATIASLAARGASDEAIDLHLEAGELDDAVAIIVREAPTVLGEGRSGTIAARIDRVPPARVATDPWLQYWRAVVTLGRDPRDSARTFERAHDLAIEAGDSIAAQLAWAGVVQAIVFTGDDFHRLDAWLARAPSPELPRSLEIAIQIETARLVALQWRRPGDPETRATAKRAFTLFHAVRDAEISLMTGGLLVVYHVFMEGDLGGASAVLDVLRTAARRPTATPLARATFGVAEALYAWARGDNDRCLALVGDALEIAAEHDIMVWNDQCWALGAAAALASRDLVAARRFLEPMADAAVRGGGFATGNYHYYAAWDAFMRGDTARAERSIYLAMALADDVGHAFARVLARIAAGLLAIQTGHEVDARAQLGEARVLADAAGSGFIEHACSLAEALLAIRSGDRTMIRERLARSFGAARRGGIGNSFWLLHEPVASACVHALDAEIEPAFVRVLVRRLGLRPEVPPVELPQWPWRFKLITLGGFDLQIDERRVGLGGKAQRVPLRLLQAIIAFGGRGVPEHRLVDALWPDAEGDAGRRVFDTTLHRLRKLLAEPGAIRMENRRIDLDSHLVWTDVWALERRLADIDPMGADDLDTAASHADRALELYRGGFLGDGDEEPWAIATRERLTTRMVNVIGRVGTRLEVAGRAREAVALYERLVTVDAAAVAVATRSRL